MTTSIHTIIIPGYSIKFSKKDTIIKITMPNISCEIDTNADEKKLDAEFIRALKQRGWRSKAIKKLQSYILWEDKWDSCINMDTETGEIS
jgi:hypothetical protein